MAGLLRSIWKNIVVYAWVHPWAKQDKLGTYGRILRWQASTMFDHSTRVVPWVNGASLSVHKGMAGVTGNLYYGLHEFADMAFFGHFLRPEDVFADIGANAGTYTVIAAKVCGAKVHSFEPARETQLLLRDNIRVNGIEDLVTVHEVALGAEAGEARFTVGRDATNKFAVDADADVQVVRVNTADAELCGEGVVAIKVDVEGAEDMVFSRIGNLLAEPQLLAVEIETLKSGVREAIEGAGFIQRYYDPFTRSLHTTKRSFYAHNHLFIRNEAEVSRRLREARPLCFGGQTV